MIETYQQLLQVLLVMPKELLEKKIVLYYDTTLEDSEVALDLFPLGKAPEKFIEEWGIFLEQDGIEMERPVIYAT